MVDLVSPVRVTNIDKNKRTANFCVQWDNNPGSCQFVNVNGVQYIAQLFALNLSNVGVSSFSAPKSIRVQESFHSPTTPGDVDGDLFVVIPSTGEVTRISYPIGATTGATEDFLVLNPQVTAIFPVAASQGSIINFVKLAVAAAGVSPPVGTGVCSGILQCTVYDFDLPPFNHSGFSYLL